MRPSKFLSRLLRWELALGALALLSGCDINFWRMDGHQSTIDVNGPVARSQLNVFYVTCWVTAAIFVIVGGVLAYATIKFRARTLEDERAVPPEQGHGNPLIEVGLIGASVLALVIIAVPTLRAIFYTYDVPEAQKGNSYEITATGLQWWFKFDYPSEQINGVGTLTTSNELVIPAGRPVRINVRSSDVIHSFWVPKLAGKVDMIPNRANFLWLQADEPGYFWGQCAEYCGDSHAVMRFRVVALAQKEFDEWVAQQAAPARNVAASAVAATAAAPRAQLAALRTYAQNESGISNLYESKPLDSWRTKQSPEKAEDAALIATGKALFLSKSCSSCHTVRGHEINGVPFGGLTAPNLTHVGSRSTIAAGLLENNPEQLRRWIHNPGDVKPGNKMYVGIGGMAGYMKKNEQGEWVPNITLTADDEVALVAYLQSLK